MDGLGTVGKLLVAAGAVVVALGLLLVLADRFPWLRLGRLPGDLRVERPGFRFYFPLGTSIALSLLLTLVLWLVRRLR